MEKSSILPCLIVITLLCCCLQETSEVISNTPYIRVGTSCCLDQNSNQICDKDETSKTSDFVSVTPTDYSITPSTTIYETVKTEPPKPSTHPEATTQQTTSTSPPPTTSTVPISQPDKYTKIKDLLLRPADYDQKTIYLKGDCLQQNPLEGIGIEGFTLSLNLHLLKDTDDSGSICAFYFGEKNFDGLVEVKGQLLSAQAFYEKLKAQIISRETNVQTVITVEPLRLYQEGLAPKAEVRVTINEQIKDTEISRKIGESTQDVKIGDTIKVGNSKVVIVGIDPTLTKTITVSVWKDEKFLSGNPIGIKQGTERKFEDVSLGDILNFSDEITEGLKDQIRVSGGKICAGDYIFEATRIDKVE